MSLLEQIWRSAPGTAIALTDGTRRASYRELQALIEHERRWLQGLGVQRCALLADNGIPWAVADLALLDGGLVNVPLPGYFTAAQCEHVLHDAGIDSVLTDQSQRLQAHGFAPRAVSAVSGLTLLSRRAVTAQPL